MTGWIRRQWKRLSARWAEGRCRRKGLSVRERFVHFSEACTENDTFLNELVRLMDAAESSAPIDMRTVVAGYESLSDATGKMVASLIRMSCARYTELLSRHEAIEREIALEVLKERPIEVLPLIVWPDEEEARQPEIVGGKAANFSIAAGSAGIEIPPFFAVTAYAYYYFMEATGLQARTREILWSLDVHDGAALREASETLVREVLAAHMPSDLEQTLRDAYGRLAKQGAGAFGVAVRSSAVMEDSERSFAGQFESILGIREDGLAEAYKQVVASKYRPGALRYAQLAGFLDMEVGMPVLIMSMLQPVASGVAYSMDPDRRDAVLVTAVRGLAAASVDGRVTPDRYSLDRGTPHTVLDSFMTDRATVLRVGLHGGTVEEAVAPPVGGPDGAGALRESTASEIARIAMRLERLFGSPVDVEWAQDDEDHILVVQCRPILGMEAEEKRTTAVVAPIAKPVLVSGGVRISGGAACGPVVRVFNHERLDGVTAGSVLVVATTSPKLAAVVGQVAAIVADAGSPTGHMATVAREFGVPSIVGARDATRILKDGMLVTVDATSGKVYEGEVPELLAGMEERRQREPKDPVRRCLKQLLERVAPLHLSDPDSPEFVPENCTSFHDLARFVHQKVMVEMFRIERLPRQERREAKRLKWTAPMEVFVLDLGGAVGDASGEFVRREDIVSTPMRALLEGMTDPHLRWAGPVGFDMKGFMSLVVRSAADDRRYGEPGFMLGSHDYAMFSSRLAYHFCSVDAVCNPSANRNYVRFLFYGGAAAVERREWRAHFLAEVLRRSGFEVKQVGDRVVGMLGKREAGVTCEALVMVGRLMVSARHLDMLMESRSAAETFAHAFLSGDYGFNSIREGPH